jgi:hypothetical protein
MNNPKLQFTSFTDEEIQNFNKVLDNSILNILTNKRQNLSDEFLDEALTMLNDLQNKDYFKDINKLKS